MARHVIVCTAVLLAGCSAPATPPQAAGGAGARPPRATPGAGPAPPRPRLRRLAGRSTAAAPAAPSAAPAAPPRPPPAPAAGAGGAGGARDRRHRHRNRSSATSRCRPGRPCRSSCGPRWPRTRAPSRRPCSGVLRRPLVVDGVEVVPAGAGVTGSVTAAERSARVKGRARLALRFTSVTIDRRSRCRWHGVDRARSPGDEEEGRRQDRHRRRRRRGHRRDCRRREGRRHRRHRRRRGGHRRRAGDARRGSRAARRHRAVDDAHAAARRCASRAAVAAVPGTGERPTSERCTTLSPCLDGSCSARCWPLSSSSGLARPAAQPAAAGGDAAHRRRHHARPGAGRLSAVRPALVGRQPRAVLRVADARRGRGRDLGRRARRRRAARLSDDERRMAPLANGWWDTQPHAHPGRRPRRHRRHRQRRRRRASTSTRTSAPSRRRAGPAAARTSPSCATTRCSSCRSTRSTAAALVQLVDAAARPAPAKLTDSQRTARKEEQQLIDWVEQAAARRARQEARDRALAPLRVELAERQRDRRCRAAVPTTPTSVAGGRDGAQAAHRAGAALRVRVVLHRGDQRPHLRRRRAGGPAAGWRST